MRSNAVASKEQPAASEVDFFEWLEETETRVLISFDDGRYYAFCLDFGITGTGSTEDEAIGDATSLLMRYLNVAFAEGRPYRESKKSSPVRIRARSWYLEWRSKLHGLKPSLSRLGVLVSVPTADPESQRLAH